MKFKIIFMVLLLSLSLLPHYHIILKENNSSNYIFSSENNGLNLTSKTITNKIESKNSIASSKIVQNSVEKIDTSSNSINSYQNKNDNLRNIKILSDGEHKWNSDISFSGVLVTQKVILSLQLKFH